MTHRYFITVLLATAGLVVSVMAQERAPAVNSSAASGSEPRTASKANSTATHGSTNPKDATAGATEASLRLEGEKRFRTNCVRCHQPPHKFPPRVMATAIRHMRIRAMITDEDMRLILRYMTE
jgi:mono/diheme cytochrome c family protein